MGEAPPGGVGEQPVGDEQRGALRDHQRQGQRGGGVGAGLFSIPVNMRLLTPHIPRSGALFAFTTRDLARSP